MSKPQARRRAVRRAQGLPPHVRPVARDAADHGRLRKLGAVLACTDTGLINGQTYFYKVTAVNAVGEGPQSNEASATPTSPRPRPAGWMAFDANQGCGPLTMLDTRRWPRIAAVCLPDTRYAHML
jgi:hypothetical protein